MPDRSQLTALVLGAIALVATTAAIMLWLTRGASPPEDPSAARVTIETLPASEPSASRVLSAERGALAATPAGDAQIQTLGQNDEQSPANQLDGVGTGTFINERELTPQAVRGLIAIYRYPPPRGRFWYDKRSGLYGIWGHEAAGYIHPDHNFGPMPANASDGDTGVFINGREINDAELLFLQVLFNGQVRQGRAWLDGRTWNIGAEGSPVPIANLAAAIQQGQQRYRGGSSDFGWRDGSGAVLAGDGKCTMMAVPGAPVYSSGC